MPVVEVPLVPPEGIFHAIALPVPIAKTHSGAADSIAIALCVYRVDRRQPRPEDRVFVDSISIRR